MGPVCPIYGCGALLVIGFLMPFKDSLVMVFAVGMVVTSLLEYITSYAMEKLFHSRWWDYSNNKFNITGRVCLLNSVLFGLLCVFVMFRLHPEVVRIVGRLSYVMVQVFAIIFIIIMTADTTVTVQTVFSLNERMKRLKEISGEIKEKLDEKQLYMEGQLSDRIAMLKANIQDSERYKDITEAAERLSRELSRISSSDRFLHKRLIHAFPEMKPTGFQEQLNSIIKDIEKRKQEKKSRKQKRKNK